MHGTDAVNDITDITDITDVIDVIDVTDVTLCVFPHDGGWSLFRQHPGVGCKITCLSAREEGVVDDNLVTTGGCNATGRAGLLLMHLHRRLDRFGLATQDDDGQPVFAQFPINQQHTANRLGLSLVQADKTLKCL